MNTKPANHNKRWNESDDAKLNMMFEHGVSINDIAAFLGRTPGTINWRIYHLGLRPTADTINDELARETGPVLPGENGEMVAVGTKDDLPPRDESTAKSNITGNPILPKRIPIEMIEKRWLWGLIVIVRWKYAPQRHAGFPPSVEIVAP